MLKFVKLTDFSVKIACFQGVSKKNYSFSKVIL